MNSATQLALTQNFPEVVERDHLRRRCMIAMWMLLGLFVLRVVGQVLVAFFDVRFLPPMSQWYSGLLPYPQLAQSSGRMSSAPR